ncbi:hypothetical protein V6R98_25210 [Agrobacterium sp. CCNWLW71]|jgi:hypothetical protein|uniref:hypothetical protein n=1 Tax=unclassified Agrobacterium TaxID=2632611 RepID=UPI002FF3F16B
MVRVKFMPLTRIAFALATSLAFATPSAAQTNGSPNPLIADKSIQWEKNQFLSTLDEQKEYAFLDVNDQFLIKSVPQDNMTTVRLAVLDGTRSEYASCGTIGKKWEEGLPGTSWLMISYSKPNPTGHREFTVQRTLDLYGTLRTYRFQTDGKREISLDEGITLSLSNNILTYTQIGGPIGFSGEISALRVKYGLTDDYRDLNLTTELGKKMWLVDTQNDGGVISYSVNNLKQLPHVPGTQLAIPREKMIASPLKGPGILGTSGSLVHNVAERSDDSSDVDVQREDEDMPRAMALCPQGQPCHWSINCGMTVDCFCVPSGGPYGNVCLF